MKERRTKIKILNMLTLSGAIILFASVLISFLITNAKLESLVDDTTIVRTVESPNRLAANERKKIYLSDIEYIATNNWSYNGWENHSIQYDKNQEGNKLSLIIDGKRTYFTKGVSVHGKGQITYDISKFSTKYPRFIAYIGVDGARGANGNLWIQILASKDGNNWDSLQKTDLMSGITPAIDVDLNIEGYKYLRIYVDPNGSNAADHGTIANASLVTKDFDKSAPYYTKLHTVEYYDNILKKNSVDDNYKNNYRLVLEREFVNKIGYSNIQDAAEFKDGMVKTLDWYLANNERLEQIIEVGEIGNPTKFLDIISDIYNKYPNEFAKANSLVYAKMAVGLAATYTTDRILSPLRFGEYFANYDYVERFTLMKQLFDENKFMRVVGNAKTGELVQNDWFKDYHVQLIRMIMYDGIRGDELIWLNEYTHYKKSFSDGMVPYLSPNYNQEKLYNENNRELYNDKYLLNQYGVPYNDGIQRYWMTFEAGGICWNESRMGQSMFRINGIPAVGAYQPWHEMYFTYYQDDNGNGYWSERYGNYNGAGTTWGGGGRNRLIFDWGNKYFADQMISGSKGGTSLGYLYLGQANLNNYAKYKKSLYYNLIANSYSDDNQKIDTYFKALDVNDTNLDSYDYIINLYKKMSINNEGGTITADDWYKLALKVTESYQYYPVAMYDLLKVIRPYLEGEKRLNIDVIEKEKLTAAMNVSDETLNSIGAVNAGSGVRTHARVLLGRTQPDPITFSFDGENGGKLVKDPIYALYWAYSLDGGKTFTNYTEEDFITLTKKEITSITSENDIIIRFKGLNDYRFTIDIVEGTIPEDLFGSDLENKIVGTTTSLEWRFKDTDEWTALAKKEPDLTGDKTVEVRVGYTGRSLPSASAILKFTKDNNPDTRKYISVSHLSLENVSSEATSSSQKGNAVNALDANYNTRWHSNWNGSDTERYITIKLDEAKYISSVEFVPAGGGNGKIIDGIIYGSMDGEDWIELSKMTNLTYTDQANTNEQAIANIKDFVIDDPQKVQYIRIKAEKATNGNWFTARAFNLYEDITIKKVANFSFDGKNAGKITLEDEFKGRKFQYSIDGGKTWKNASSEKHQLSSEELNKINETNGIKVKLIGDDKESLILIKKGKVPAINPYLNDLENRLLRMTDIEKLEWKIEDGAWTSYEDSEPIVTGNRKLYVRAKATRNILASDALEYQFTDDNQKDDMKYISIKHETIHEYSTQSIDSSRPFYAPNAIDGDPDTLWHTDFRYDVRQQEGNPFITIKLDEPRYISALEFIQKKYRAVDPDYIKNGIVYVSEDGINWKEAGRIENCPQDNELKQIKFSESVYGQYVKLEMETYDIFASLATVNLYEDSTKKVLDDSSIEYSITKKTNKNVVATLVTDGNIVVTNNNGSNKYTFTKNGEFTFVYIDATGKPKSLTAKVDWIDKEAPVGKIKYSTRDITNGSVIVTLETSEPVTIANNNGSNKYTFKENGEFTFEFVDIAGNKGTATAVVDWIDKDAPTAKVKYSTTSPTNKEVIATLNVEDGVIVTNNGGSNKYTFKENGTFKFEFMDKAGNNGSITAKVDWIDRTAPKGAITYSTTSSTNKEVVATLVGNEKITVLNNDKKESYTFTKNGEFTFEFADEAGNKSTITAKVNWIDKDVPIGIIKYSTSDITNEDVIVTLETNEPVTMTNNNGSNKYTFKENGKFTFEFVDAAGNKGTAIAKVDWINKNAPTAKVKYSTTNPTNKEVIATLNVEDGVIVTNNGGSNKYTFKENGTFKFEFMDKAGNKGTLTAKVNWIDKDVPIGTIKYSTSDITNEDVIVTLETNEPVTITNNGGSNKYTFKENGTYTFEFVDAAGNKGTAIAKVDWINKNAPTAKVKYSTTSPTNKEVIATLNVEDGVIVTNNGGSNKYTFKENGEFTFEFVDAAGNKGTATTKVNWIDKDAPIGTIKYSVKDVTNEDVIVTLETNEPVTIINNGGSNKYKFTKSGTFKFEFVDKAGNKGTAIAVVDWIDKDAPPASIKYNTINLTNRNVTATLNVEDGVIVTNNGGSNKYTFKENGTFKFEFMDKTGNKGTLNAKVNWIDKDVPIGTIKYSTKDLTNEDVIVTLETNEPVTITNNSGSNKYTFKENGEFTFEFVDVAGNKGKSTAKVTWIKTKPFKVQFNNKDKTDKPVTVTLDLADGVIITNNGGSNKYTFKENGTFRFEYIDKDGNKGTYVAKVDWIKKSEKPAKTEVQVKPSKPNKKVNINTKTNSNNQQSSNSSSIKYENNLNSNSVKDITNQNSNSNYTDDIDKEENNNTSNENTKQESVDHEKENIKNSNEKNKQLKEDEEKDLEKKSNNSLPKYLFISLIVIISLLAAIYGIMKIKQKNN